MADNNNKDAVGQQNNIEAVKLEVSETKDSTPISGQEEFNNAAETATEKNNALSEEELREIRKNMGSIFDVPEDPMDFVSNKKHLSEEEIIKRKKK